LSITDAIPNRVASYSYKNGVYSVELKYLAVQPYGAFVSTINDLAKFEASLFQHKLRTADTLTRMAGPTKLKDGSNTFCNDAPNMGYRLGLVLSTFNGQPRVWPGGSLAGFRTVY
jgi:CubicO group peptidase (beta-lactamase class C family)